MVLGRLVIALIKGYRYIFSPLLPRSCRFHPSCSRYAMEAIAMHGLAKGLKLALLRICRCHPFHPGGYDPVPPISPLQHTGPERWNREHSSQ